MAEEKNSAQENASENQDSGKKPFMKRVTPYLTFGVLVLALISALIDVPQKIIDLFKRKVVVDTVDTIDAIETVDTNSLHPGPINFFGVVRFAGTNDPVAGAFIRVKPKKEVKIVIGQGTTDSKGEFNFKIKARPDDAVWVVVIKNKWPGFEGFLVPNAEKMIPFSRKP